MKRTAMPQRKVPMRRTPFVNATGRRVMTATFGGKTVTFGAPEPAPSFGHQWTMEARKAPVHRRDETCKPIPKRQYVRSPALLAAVRKLPCQVTGIVGQTEPAHSNWERYGGKGKSIKASDECIAAIHRDLHRELDQGSRMSEAERQRLWFDAHRKTVALLLQRGEWPAGVPVPNTARNPFDDAERE